MQAVQTRMVLCEPFTIARTRRRLGFQRRLVTLCAWLMRLPYWGLFPQISQARAILLPLRTAQMRDTPIPILSKPLDFAHAYRTQKLFFGFLSRRATMSP